MAVITAEPASETANNDGSEEVQQAPQPRIAYLLSRYPARSHTFLLNEVLGLRVRGLHIEVASINKPDRALDQLPPIEAEEARKTFYVKSKPLQAAFAILGTALTSPKRILRGLQTIRQLPSLSLRQRAFWLFYLAEALLTGRWMRQRNCSHLHVHFGGAVASVGMLTSIMWEMPYSLTIHGPEELLDPQGYQFPAKLAQAGFVICISNFCKQQLQSLTEPAHWSKLTVIRLGVDPRRLVPSTARSKATAAASLKLCCVGRLVPEKGHRILLQALSMLRSRGVEMMVTLIGTGPLESDLQGYATTLKLQESVHFASGLSHAETLNFVGEANIFALASFAEGVPVALMEAMSLAVPCVSTTIAGIPELIHSGESGLLVRPGNVEALADALHALASDEGLRRRLAAAGRQRVLSDYNLPNNLEQLAQHFRDYFAGLALRKVLALKTITKIQA